MENIADRDYIHSERKRVCKNLIIKILCEYHDFRVKTKYYS